MSTKPNESTRVPLALQAADDKFDPAKFKSDVADGVVRLVNEQRAKKGLPPLAP